MHYDPTSGQSTATALWPARPQRISATWKSFVNLRVQRRHQSSDEHHSSQGNQAEPQQPHPALRLRRLNSISLSPNFVFTRRIWFDHGGVYVVANLRGGGEFGEQWQQVREPHQKTKRLRRFRRLRRIPPQKRLHAPRQIRRRRRKQRRPIDGGLPHPTPEPPTRRRRTRRHLRFPPHRTRTQRRLQRHRIRHRQKTKTNSTR